MADRIGDTNMFEMGNEYFVDPETEEKVSGPMQVRVEESVLPGLLKVQGRNRVYAATGNKIEDFLQACIPNS